MPWFKAWPGRPDHVRVNPMLTRGVDALSRSLAESGERMDRIAGRLAVGTLDDGADSRELDTAAVARPDRSVPAGPPIERFDHAVELASLLRERMLAGVDVAGIRVANRMSRELLDLLE
jgi:hypothetical protein